MIHIGEAAFYERVHKDALAHDAVLLEGVKSPITTRLTRAYRWITTAKNLQLVVQPRLQPAPADAHAILADLSHEEFLVEWKKVPLLLKLLLYVVAPLHGLHQRWFATRHSLIKGHSLDDLPARDEVLGWSPEKALVFQAIRDARDRCLIQRLNGALANPGLRKIAVVYGAQHMRAVLAELVQRQKYRVGDMDWMTVISL